MKRKNLKVDNPENTTVHLGLSVTSVWVEISGEGQFWNFRVEASGQL